MNTYTNKFPKTDVPKLKNFFTLKKAEFQSQQYAIFRAKTKSFTAIFYESGKFLIQGSEISQLIEEFENYMDLNQSQILLINTSEKSTIKRIQMDYSEYIGTDESGKGDFFGPLVVAGVLVTEQTKKLFINLGIKDSKKLTDEKILKLSNGIKKNAPFSIVTINNEKYNELYAKFKNLNKLLAWGHARIIENLLEKNPNCNNVICDQFGNENLIQNALLDKGKNIHLFQQTKAEEDIAVAAASVIARAEFVLKIQSLQRKYAIEFPKGASQKVIEIAKEYAKKYGKQRLNEVSKLHFKTFELI